MIRWFQALMPKQGRFFDQFEAHAVTLVAGADALHKLLSGQGTIAAHCAEIVEREHQADAIIADVLRDVRATLVTPFDRSAITDLISAMDDAIDQMNQTATAITLYDYVLFEPKMAEMAGVIVRQAQLTAKAVPLLRSLASNSTDLTTYTAELVKLEGEGDEMHDDGLRTLFHAKQDRPMEFIVGREIYNHLERVVDRFEDIANEIQGLVIDHA